MKICAIGNSHLAAMKKGWDLIRSDRPYEVTFFGTARSAMNALQLVDGELQPGSEALRSWFLRTSEGLETIRDEYDAYVLAGMGFSFGHACVQLRSHRPFDCPRGDKHQLVSWNALLAAVSDQLDDSSALKTLAKVQAFTAKPIAYTHDPYFARASLADSRYEYMHHEVLVRPIFDLYRSRLEALSQTCRLAEQPAETIEGGWWTKEDYWRGSSRGFTSDAALATDFGHMNARYGALVLDRLVKRALA